MERPVKVTILEQEYLIKSDEDEEKVRNIARFVNDRLLEIKNHSGGLSDRKTAILAAFHIASDYFELVKKHGHLLKEVDRRVQGLSSHIDAFLK